MFCEDIWDYFFFTLEDLVIVLNEICYTEHVFSVMVVVDGAFSEFLVHVRVEVANQKMGPEFIKEFHIVVYFTNRTRFSVSQCSRTNCIVGFVLVFFSNGSLGFLAFDPHNRRRIAKYEPRRRHFKRTSRPVKSVGGAVYIVRGGF